MYVPQHTWLSNSLKLTNHIYYFGVIRPINWYQCHIAPLIVFHLYDLYMAIVKCMVLFTGLCCYHVVYKCDTLPSTLCTLEKTKYLSVYEVWRLMLEGVEHTTCSYI